MTKNSISGEAAQEINSFWFKRKVPQPRMTIPVSFISTKDTKWAEQQMPKRTERVCPANVMKLSGHNSVIFQKG